MRHPPAPAETDRRPATRHLLTGDDDRLANMTAFATAALTLLVDQLR